jgi:hypothetical protein
MYVICLVKPTVAGDHQKSPFVWCAWRRHRPWVSVGEEGGHRWAQVLVGAGAEKKRELWAWGGLSFWAAAHVALERKMKGREKESGSVSAARALVTVCRGSLWARRQYMKRERAKSKHAHENAQKNRGGGSLAWVGGLCHAFFSLALLFFEKVHVEVNETAES